MLKFALDLSSNEMIYLQSMFDEAEIIFNQAFAVASGLKSSFMQQGGYKYWLIYKKTEYSEQNRSIALDKYKDIEKETGFTNSNLRLLVKRDVEIDKLPACSVDAIINFVFNSVRFGGGVGAFDGHFQIFGASKENGRDTLKGIRIEDEKYLTIQTKSGKIKYRLGRIIKGNLDMLDTVQRVSLAKSNNGEFMAIAYTNDYDSLSSIPMETKQSQEFPILMNDTIQGKLNELFNQYIEERLLAFTYGRKKHWFKFDTEDSEFLIDKFLPFLYANPNKTLLGSAIIDAQNIHFMSLTDDSFKGLLAEQVMRFYVMEFDDNLFTPFMNFIEMHTSDGRYAIPFDGLYKEGNTRVIVITRHSPQRFTVRFE